MTTHISEKIETKGLAEASAAEVLSAPSSPLDDLSTPDSPDGGTEAWLFVLAGFLVLCNSWYARSILISRAELIEYPGQSQTPMAPSRHTTNSASCPTTALQLSPGSAPLNPR